MSVGWDAYITSLRESAPPIKRAAIVGLADQSTWARSTGANEFKATDVELQRLIDGFQDINSIPQTGVDLEGTHYVVPLVENNLIFGKKNKLGFFALKLKTAVIIAIIEGEAADVSLARTSIEKLGEYLADSNY